MVAATEAVVGQAITALVVQVTVVLQAQTTINTEAVDVVAWRLEESLEESQDKTTMAEAAEDTINLAGPAHLVAPLTAHPQAVHQAHLVSILQK